MWRISFTFIFLISWTGSALSKQFLSLDQCLEIARTKSPQAIDGLLSEEKAKGTLRETSSRKLPHVFAVGAVSTSDDPSTQLPDANRGIVRAEQNLYPFSSDWVKVDQSRALVRAAGFSKLESESDVALLVKQLYFSILRDRRAIQSYEEVNAQFHRLQETIVPRYTVGRVPPFDLVKVKTSIADVERNLDATSAQLSGEETQLSLILGVQDSGLELKPLTSLPEIPAVETDSMSQNPTLLSISAQTEASKFGLSATKRSRLPSLLAGADYGYSGQKIDSMSLGWGADVELRLPLWDWSEISSQVSQQKTELALSENRFELERQKIGTDFAETQASAKAHLADEKRVKAFFTEVKQAAQTSVQRYRQGASGILEATEAIDLWLQTLLNEQAAYYGYLSDLAKIERLTGKSSVHYE